MPGHRRRKRASLERFPIRALRALPRRLAQRCMSTLWEAKAVEETVEQQKRDLDEALEEAEDRGE